MLSLELGAEDWQVAQIEIDDGLTVGQWTASASTLSAAAAMDEIAAWASATFAPTFSWTWARDATTGGAIFTLSATAYYTIEPLDTLAEDLLGVPSGVTGPAFSVTFAAAAAGTWAPLSGVSVRASLRQLARGDAPGDGGVRPGVPGLATLRQSVTAAGTAIDAARLSAVLAAASSPRRVDIYQLHTGDWLRLALGEVSRTAAGAMHYRFDLTATGDAI